MEQTIIDTAAEDLKYTTFREEQLKRLFALLPEQERGLSEARQHSEPREAMTGRAGILITDSSGRASTFVFPFSHV